ncbi:LytR/AlgR family response regulator transcription factor [Aquibacillus kalidii]|uniref:LytR/AlgR family response regulator transcription factor n=1 Tax=Aquibacillus kalidii TaxID=2762597 RepID=UPI00164679FD|nr:LytTR family DNA-binding domain-containing protein [Aquibacillus kalidii]
MFIGSRIKVVIAEDNSEAQDILMSFIEPIDTFEIIGIADDGESLLNLNMELSPDLIIADIDMPKLNGVEAISACLKMNPALKIIFTTAYDKYAVKAFDLAAVDYVMKPVKKERLYVALDKVKSASESTNKQQNSKNIITIKMDRISYFIHLKNIIFIERENRKTIIHTHNQKYETNESLNTLLDQLDKRFFRTHRSFIVNIHAISHLSLEGETYFAHFKNYPDYAHVSKLQKNELMRELS